MIFTETEVSNLLEKLFDKLFPKDISVTVRGEPTDPVVVVWLHVNGRYAAKIQCLIESDTTILIGDIQHDEERPKYNKGYGTMMMEKLLELQKQMEKQSQGAPPEQENAEQPDVAAMMEELQALRAQVAAQNEPEPAEQAAEQEPALEDIIQEFSDNEENHK